MTERRARLDGVCGSAADGVVLELKAEPAQGRSRETYETILATAGRLLAEVGFERLTTNLVCERAGLTPPALYRYFPNKYAILAELARRLMARFDDVLARFLAASAERPATTAEDYAANQSRYQADIVAATRAMPGGVWILRSARAIPVIEDIRRDQQRRAADLVYERFRRRFPAVVPELLRISCQLMVELSYAAIEIALLHDEAGAAAVSAEVSMMSAAYVDNLVHRHGHSLRDTMASSALRPEGGAVTS